MMGSPFDCPRSPEALTLLRVSVESNLVEDPITHGGLVWNPNGGVVGVNWDPGKEV